MIARLNTRVALAVTRAVGSMWCAYAFAVLAILGLPTALQPGGVGVVAWFAQTFLQLVLLSILAVGQQVHTEALDDHRTETGQHLRAVHARLDALDPSSPTLETTP